MTARDWKADVNAIRKILIAEWDPIGCGVPEDEYDSYIGDIYGHMQRKVSADELAQHLGAIETDQMGLPVNPERYQANFRVSQALLALMD